LYDTDTHTIRLNAYFAILVRSKNEKRRRIAYSAWSWPRETRSRFAILIAFTFHLQNAGHGTDRLREEWRRNW